MSATSATQAGRAAAEALMHDSCIIHRPTGGLDASYEPVATREYLGKCKVQTYEPHEQTADVGGGTATVQRYSVHVPVGSFAPALGDVVTIVRCALDPKLEGRRLVVRALLHKSYATAYRVGADDLDAYGEA